MTMDLDLEAARADHESERRILAEFDRVRIESRKAMLERVAVAVLASLAQASNTQAQLAPPKSASPSGPPDQKHWQEILNYCRAHPTSDGTFRFVDLARALDPERFATSRSVAFSSIYTAVKRRSVGQSDDPYFVLLSDGRFRPATEAERVKPRAATTTSSVEHAAEKGVTRDEWHAALDEILKDWRTIKDAVAELEKRGMPLKYGTVYAHAMRAAHVGDYEVDPATKRYRTKPKTEPNKNA